ncbi:hypothetical protein [Rhizobium sp. AG855]|uniref:hypothetical protein n=1 Tax=Rhizobium sp. AG855 TaxID=2183898 RepID=UPI000E76471F|nr:hypothetical protein [Rhizobium sp. AG855]RKE85423.1 hypothetical protein DFO46_2220 [Rhizobium sp. AG855]
MAKFSEQMQSIFDRYTEEVDSGPVSLDDVATWAISEGLFKPQPRDVVKICREALAESLRQEKRVDSNGRRYRAKHSVRTNIGGVQLSLWADIDTAPRSFMEKSFSQRRKAIADDCFQIKQDVDHFNEVNPTELPLLVVLDFTDDVAEMEAAGRVGRDEDGEAA